VVTLAAFIGYFVGVLTMVIIHNLFADAPEMDEPPND
jgi:hypothetical protein